MKLLDLRIRCSSINLKRFNLCKFVYTFIHIIGHYFEIDHLRWFRGSVIICESTISGDSGTLDTSYEFSRLTMVANLPPREVLTHRLYVAQIIVQDAPVGVLLQSADTYMLANPTPPPGQGQKVRSEYFESSAILVLRACDCSYMLAT